MATGMVNQVWFIYLRNVHSHVHLFIPFLAISRNAKEKV